MFRYDTCILFEVTEKEGKKYTENIALFTI